MKRLGWHLPARERRVLEWLEASANNAATAADRLDELLHHYPDRTDLADEIVGCKRDGERLVAALEAHLATTYVAVLEPDDVRLLMAEIQAVVDLADDTASHLRAYHLGNPRREAQRMAQMLLTSTRHLQATMPALRDMERIEEPLDEIHRLAEEAEATATDGIADLFGDTSDARALVGWERTLERLRAAIDACARASMVLRRLLRRHG